MRTFQTACKRSLAPVTQRPLAVALALGLTPLAGMAGNLISVTTSGDDGNASTCTLRQAIVSMNTQSAAGTNCAISAAGIDTITFSSDNFPNGATNTITLADAVASTLQVSDANLTIDASANGGVTIQRPLGASNSFGILNASPAVSGTLTLDHLTLSNGAGGACDGNGGAICASHTNLALINCTVSGNSSGSRGGAIYSEFGSVTVTNSTLSGNSSGADAGAFLTDGGAISAVHSGVTLANSALSGNSAVFGSGGGISAIAGDVTLTGSTLSANTAKRGGGISAQAGAIFLTNSTLSGNSAANWGGGIYSAYGDAVELTNSTVSANSAGVVNVNGGGIFRKTNTYSAIQVNNSIVAGNVGGDLNKDLTVSSSGNIIGGDPQLGALAANGGPTETMLPLPGSPAIDAIACTNAPATDQRGVARPQGAQCDIGAVEVSERIFADNFDGIAAP